jgi:hypothetical protein
MAKRFLLKISLFLLPFVVILVAYFITDPFKVLYHYNSYYISNSPLGVGLNRDFVSFETLKTNSRAIKYDSYIFGNSRSIFYRVSEWKKYIGDSATCFHFDASGESLYGIQKKIEFLDKKKAVIKNALLIIDTSLLTNTTDDKGHLFIKHPTLSGANSLLYQLQYLKAYLNPKFITAYYDYLFNKKVKSYMLNNFLLNGIRVKYDVLTNELQHSEEDSILEKDSSYFYRQRRKLFYERDNVVHIAQPVIGTDQIKMLQYIKKIFLKNSTEYKIVISPLYDQKRINDSDLKILYSIFGIRKVFDFSGINDITRDLHNYYETSHYRPHVASQILKTIYNTK